MKLVLALDFDGVICDSAGEMAVAAWRAGQVFWPEWQTPEPPSDLIDKFRSLRPVVVTGYQSIALMRLLYCQRSMMQIRVDFPRLEEDLFAALGESRENLIRQFGLTRDLWIAEDPAGWRSKHFFYPGIVTALRYALNQGHEIFILSTKQVRFTVRLLHDADIAIPVSRISGLEKGRTKDDLLLELYLQSQRGDTWYFVEDRPEALLQAAQRPELKNVHCLLAAWGYNFPEERQECISHPAIDVIDLPHFITLCTSL